MKIPVVDIEKFFRNLSLAVAIWTATGAVAADLTLVQDGKSDFQIVIPLNPPTDVQLAAGELQNYLRQISGADLPIVTDDHPPAPKAILLGNHRRLDELRPRIDFARMGEEGFIVRTVGEGLVIAGGPRRGTLYGVYSFLEDTLGCRWYSSKVSRIPRQRTLILPEINNTQVPAFKYREVFYRDTMNPAWGRAHKLNGSTNVKPEENEWGTWCHSFYSFVPPERYFASHPEYYSLVDGKRVHTFMYGPVEYTAQLCLSNPEVRQITIAELKRRMGLHPQARYWSISQMDGHKTACQCPGCRALDEREGSPIGSILEFVNQVAAEFPDQTMATLAYTYTRRPPKTLRPARNVAIQLCSIECQRAQAARPIATDPLHRSFRDDLKAWSAICDQLIIWDYVIQFGSLVSPYPNLRVLQPNLQFFAAHHVQGVFAQGNREIGGEFCELRAYLLAKLLWNPNGDVNRILDDFLSGYYGPAAAPLRRYIDLMHDTAESSDTRLSMDGKPLDYRQGYLAPPMLARYDALFDEAERLTGGDPDLLLRVQTARMPLLYAQLELGFGEVETRIQRAHKLFTLAERTGLQMFSEVELTTAKYKARILAALEKEKQAKPRPGASTWTHPLTKKGRLKSPLVEVTPFAFRKRLYRLENWQKQWEFSGSPEGSRFQEDQVRIRDVEADRVVSVPLVGHGLGIALVWEDRIYVFAGNWGKEKKWNINEIEMTSSTDLVHWTQPVVVLKAEPQEKFFNVSVCRGKETFVLLVESNDPAWPAFTFKYFVADDLVHWRRVPEGIYGREKYVGGPALYYEGDYYYTLYLQSLGGKWETRLTRSKDLVHWQDAPEGRPFVTFNPEHTGLPLRPPNLQECNASDAELCAWQGKTLVYFTGSDQVIGGDLQWAEFDGTPRELLEHFYAEPAVVVPSSR